MEKGFWGPSTWCMIHTAAAGYNPGNRTSFKQFINSLPFLLPCEYCRNHLVQNLKAIPLNDIALHSSRNLFIWSYNLHDLVNKQLKKTPSPPYSGTEKYYFEYTRNNNFWGPCFWRAIHSFAASYRPTPEVKRAFKQFIYSLPGVIPCQTCSQLYINVLSSYSLSLTDNVLSDAHNLFLWSYRLHEIINLYLGKTSPQFETIKAQYFNNNVCSSCGAN